MLNPVPGLTRSLTALSKILDKAEAHAEAMKLKPEVIPQLRLIADMLPLWRQITIACDHAKGATARLGQVENPAMADVETTIAELKDRIARTIAFMASVPASAFDGAESRRVTIKVAGQDRELAAAEYYQSVAIPNFYFHMATAHAILRSNGVVIGKTDFIGA